MTNELHFALVIGINGYPGLTRGSLRSAKGDAEAFRAWLTDAEGGGLPEANVESVMTEDPAPHDSLNAHPIKHDVDTALRRLHRKVREKLGVNPIDWEKTRLYLYASGHGVAPLGSEVALLMANSDDIEGAHDNIELGAYRLWYVQCGVFKEVVVFADCCRQVEQLAVAGRFQDDCSQSMGAVKTAWGYATAHGTVAYEPTSDEDSGGDPDAERGYFTEALLLGLKGAASRDQVSGQITSHTLEEFVRNRVKQRTQDKPVPQQAMIFSAEPLLFGSPPPLDTWDVRITFTTSNGASVRLLDGTHAEVGTHDPSTGPWDLPLSKGLYRLVRGAQEVEFAVQGGDVSVQFP